METTVEKKSIQSEMLEDVLTGLRQSQKTLPSKYFYDETGSQLFEQITELEEYYLTRTELQIMLENVDEITSNLGENIQLVEPGSGSSTKTRLLLDNIHNIHSYIPVDISRSFLDEVAKRLRNEYPDLDIQPVAADYTKTLPLPEISEETRRVIYFPGSTVGNFKKEEAKEFIGLLADSLNNQGGLLIGFDLVKNRDILVNAYNDSKGVTAQFNKNILRRINRELHANFDLHQFKHKAFFNEEKSRIEMHLVSLSDQVVTIGGEKIPFVKGETIHTENSHKYTLSSFREMTKPYFEHVDTWTDPNNYFAVQFLHNE